MKRTNKRFLVPMAFMLALAICFSSLAPVTAFAATEKKNVVSTTGEATITVVPDMAVLTLGVSSTDKDVKVAYKDNKTKMTAILDELEKLGIAKKDIKTTTYTVTPNYEWVDNSSVLNGYTVTNLVTVKVRDLDKVGSVLENSILQESNAINGLEYKLSDNSKAYRSALKLAIKDAKAKATEMVGALGYKKVTATTIRENYVGEVGPIYYSKAAMEATAGAPVSSGTLEIKATVSVDFNY